MTNNIEPVEIEKNEIADVNEVVEVKTEKPQKVKVPKNPVIQKDILRYKKNKLASLLAIGGLALGCLYFLVLYAQVYPSEEFYNFVYYTWEIAIDVVYNLFFLLFVFLFSEQVKNYERKMFPFQLIIGALQIARIFWLPLKGINNDIPVSSFVIMVIALAASGACIVASAIIGYIRSKHVEEFNKQLENGEVDLDAELKKEDTNAGGEVNA